MREDGNRSDAARLDAFVDAAFAFALTLLVATNAGTTGTLIAALDAALASLPAFVFGFAVLAMFWHEHVSWRRLASNAHWSATLLSLALVFVVLSFVLALGPMAGAIADYALGGHTGQFRGADLPALYRIYGAGFAMMCALVMLLFLQGMRHGTPANPPELRGRAIIYGLMAGIASLSVIVALIPATAFSAAFAYALLPPVIGLFAWRFDWGSGVAPDGPQRPQADPHPDHVQHR
ncbi:TMEM175 family protein [Sandaracinobacteroides saxicola]|uniref:DUF1211 domain-containing protein n=1 Tax=Sandaracinobacteroides saxicola TaxID=2759707 RepID=A0A7G5IIX1_9SPHN|nr:TMEM175 family protein [Sandaracinobacteroides saxicola]QMW23313.1 DUF1211 domain-containing protein [Sandaracinobacteroides saxicola]